MQLSELLGTVVRDSHGQRLGTVTDVRLAITGDPNRSPDSPIVFGLVVSPRTTTSYLGYERSQVCRPALVAALLRWRHRGTFLTLWTEVTAVSSDAITVGEGFRRYSPVLRNN